MATTIVASNSDWSFDIDALEEIEDGKKGTLTDHKIESGANVNDHFIRESQIIPIKGVIGENTFEGDGKTTLLKDVVRQKLKAAYENAELIDILNDDMSFFDVILIDYKFPKRINQGKALFLELTFKEVRFAETKTVKVGNVPKSAIAKTNPKLTQDKKIKETKKSRQRAGAKGHKGKKVSLPIATLSKYGY